MIPTRSQAKLPKALSYPLGAEAISAALADAPHAAEFGLWFCADTGSSASLFQQRLREGRPTKVLAAEYVPAQGPGYSRSRGLVEGGWYDARWSLDVYPVLRGRRHPVGQALRERGLPAVVEWLRGSDAVGWDTRHHRIELVFNPAEGTLSINREDGA
jgi:hypothetical protein